MKRIAKSRVICLSKMSCLSCEQAETKQRKGFNETLVHLLYWKLKIEVILYLTAEPFRLHAPLSNFHEKTDEGNVREIEEQKILSISFTLL